MLLVEEANFEPSVDLGCEGDARADVGGPSRSTSSEVNSLRITIYKSKEEARSGAGVEIQAPVESFPRVGLIHETVRLNQVTGSTRGLPVGAAAARIALFALPAVLSACGAAPGDQALEPRI